MENSLVPHSIDPFSLRYVPGFFVQGDPTRTDFTTDVCLPHLGLKNEKTWQDVADAIEKSKKHGVNMKLIIMLRHGEGLHNADKARVGEVIWETEYQFNSIYIDAPLTAAGIEQSQEAALALEHEIEFGGLALDRIIVSPLDRTLQTYEYALAKLQDIPVTAMELVRETLGVCPCDKRKSMAGKRTAYSHIDYSGVTDEDDPWWKVDHRETDEEITDRARKFLHHIFYDRPETSFLVVSHSGFSRGCFRALGHRYYRPQNAEFIPLLVTETAESE